MEAATQLLAGLFLSTEGRIGRLRFWMGTLILLAVSAAATGLILAVAGVSDTAVMLSVASLSRWPNPPTR